MRTLAPLCSAFSVFLVLVGCWELELPDTKDPGFELGDVFDTSDISLGTDSTAVDGDTTESGTDTSDTSSLAPGLTCPEVPCNLPPLSICENSTTLRVYLDVGTCYEGECIYAWNLKPCAEFGCATGGCLADPCTDVICDLPPDNACANSNTLIIWDTDGQCDTAGVCHYPGSTVGCPLGCEGAACN